MFFLPIPQCNLFCLHPSISPAFSLTKYLIYDFVDIFGSILAKNVRVPFVEALRRLAIAEKSKLWSQFEMVWIFNGYNKSVQSKKTFRSNLIIVIIV